MLRIPSRPASKGILPPPAVMSTTRGSETAKLSPQPVGLGGREIVGESAVIAKSLISDHSFAPSLQCFVHLATLGYNVTAGSHSGDKGFVIDAHAK